MSKQIADRKIEYRQDSSINHRKEFFVWNMADKLDDFVTNYERKHPQSEQQQSPGPAMSYQECQGVIKRFLEKQSG